jgi:hypothetical protein
MCHILLAFAFVCIFCVCSGSGHLAFGFVWGEKQCSNHFVYNNNSASHSHAACCCDRK